MKVAVISENAGYVFFLLCGDLHTRTNHQRRLLYCLNICRCVAFTINWLSNENVPTAMWYICKYGCLINCICKYILCNMQHLPITVSDKMKHQWMGCFVIKTKHLLWIAFMLAFIQIYHYCISSIQNIVFGILHIFRRSTCTFISKFTVYIILNIFLFRGNNMSEYPYTKGPACSKCLQKQSCENKLCTGKMGDPGALQK